MAHYPAAFRGHRLRPPRFRASPTVPATRRNHPHSVVWRREGRIASYYVEYAHPPQPVKIYYDRKHSCFTRLTVDEIDWDYLLDTRHHHPSGVTVPLSENAAAIMKLAMARARERGITVSFDINYRRLLRTEAEARKALLPLSQRVDIPFVSRRDAEKAFGCRGEPEDIAAQAAELSAARIVVVTFSADGIVGREGAATHRLQARPVTVVDRIGAGDAMVAECLHGWLQGDLKLGLRSGVAMAAL